MLVQDIQVFLNFANFYQQFIQGFRRIATLLNLMLKMIKSPYKLAFNRNNGSKLTLDKNNDRKPSFGPNNDNIKIDEFGGDCIKLTKKSGKSKVQKLFKSQKLSKLEKKLSKSRNSPNFSATKVESTFLNSSTRAVFNHL